MVSSPAAQEPRWRRLPDERPRQIIEAALQEFGDRGLAAARLEDIARRAGVSKGTIYLYFPNKEALFREMIRQVVGETLASAQARITASESSATARLRAYAAAFWTYTHNPAFEKIYRIAHGELRNFPVLFYFFIQEVPVRYLVIIVDIVRHGIATGEFRDTDPDAAARLFHAMVLNLSVWSASKERICFLSGIPDDALLQQALDFCLHALARQPANPE